ncbi:MAG: hypothetical protein H7Z72_13890 [Bacteroidetes bacterium]|nr:hypothetical protein [Fibrella sp.]
MVHLIIDEPGLTIITYEMDELNWTDAFNSTMLVTRVLLLDQPDDLRLPLGGYSIVHKGTGHSQIVYLRFNHSLSTGRLA